MEVERHAGALYTTFLVEPSGARALEFHGLYCWYLSGLDTLSVGNVLAPVFLAFASRLGALVFLPFTQSLFFDDFCTTHHNFISKAYHDHGSRAMEKFDHLGVGTARAILLKGFHSQVSSHLGGALHSLRCCNVWLLWVFFVSHGSWIND
jgi:hypothetical protein